MDQWIKMNECIKMDLCMGSMDQNRSMIKMDQWSQRIEMDQIGHIGSHWITMLKWNQVESSG